MRAIIFFILIMLGVASVIITAVHLIAGQYFDEINNIKSLDDREKYMTVDYLLIQNTRDYSEGIQFDIEGKLMSDGSFLTMDVGRSDRIDFSLEYQPLYRSKLTGDYYLKGAPESYYNGKYRGLYFAIVLKIAAWFIIGWGIFKTIVYVRNRKYRF